MTEASPQPKKENETQEPAYFKHWCRDSAYNVIRLSKLLHYEIQ